MAVHCGHSNAPAEYAIKEEKDPHGMCCIGMTSVFVVNVQVVEIVNGDCLVVRLPDGSNNKIFLASIRSPRSVVMR